MVRDAAAQGIDLLEDLPIDEAGLEASESMPLDLYLELMARYTRFQNDPGWGFRFGEQLTMSAHGPLGFGAVSAPTLRDGLLFLSRYLPVRVPYATSTIEPRPSMLVIRIHHDIAAADFLSRSCETMAIVFQEFIKSARASIEPLVWRFPYPAPPHESLYRERIEGGLYFDHDCWQLEVPRSIGMLPSPFRNEAAYRATMAQCESMLLDVAGDDLTTRVRGLLASHVETRLMETVPVTEIPTADQIAGHLGVSRRTLIRQLKDAGATFQRLRDDILRAEMETLIGRGLPFREVAHRLGYADASNLTRACRRLFGCPPSHLRK